MIKDQMTLQLQTDQVNYKSTVAFWQLPDEDILPYCVGYVPEDLVNGSNLFKLKSGLVAVTQAAGGYNYSYAPQDFTQYDRGIPFAYETSTICGYNNSGTWIKPADTSAANTGGLIVAFNTDQLKSSAPTLNMNLQALIVGCLIDGNGLVKKCFVQNDYVNNKNPLALDISHNVTISNNYISGLTGATFTITQNDFDNAVKGIISKSVENVVWGNNTYHMEISYIFYNISFSPGTLPVNGSVFLMQNYRFSSGYVGVPLQTSYIKCNFNYSFFPAISSGIENTINELVSQSNLRLLNDPNYLYTAAIYSWETYLICHGININDIKILMCTCSPIYKINGEYYVPEFTEDFTITGNLIPYEDAAEWQKNINSDTNLFDTGTIPTPGHGPEPEPEGDSHTLGEIDIPAGFGGVHHIAMAADSMSYIFEKMNTLPTLLDSIKQYFSPNGNINDYLYSAKIFPVIFSGGTGGNYLQIGFDAQNTLPISGRCKDISRIQTYSGVSIDVRKLSDKEFFNYAPYTNLYLKVPYCDEIELNPEIVAGHTISLSFAVDVLTGMMGVYAMCGGKLAGYTSGKIGVDLMRSSVDVARYGQNQVNALASGITSAISTVAGIATGNAAATISGITGITGATISGASAKSVTNISGYTGDFSGGLDSTDIYIRYIYAVPVIPDTGNETDGFIEYSIKSLGSCSGFTTCINPKIDIDCTDYEKSEIRRLLESGVYL